MRIQEFTFTLKDGRTALVRSPEEKDVMPMLEYLRTVAGETDFLMNYPEETSKYTPEGEKALFERVNSSDLEAMPVCFIDGRIAGNCMITFNGRIKTRHRASVAIALKREFWGQGIGTRLMQEMIRIAEEKDYVTQLELDFIEGNLRAKALYEKMGFKVVAVKPDAIRLKDGTLLAEYSMVRKMSTDCLSCTAPGSDPCCQG